MAGLASARAPAHAVKNSGYLEARQINGKTVLSSPIGVTERRRQRPAMMTSVGELARAALTVRRVEFLTVAARDATVDARKAHRIVRQSLYADRTC